MNGQTKITLIGGPTALVEMDGLRLLTDPTFDPPGEYHHGPITLKKTAGPAFGADALGHLDAVLLSHDQHDDNLDQSGRALLASTDRVVTTPAGAGRLGGNAIGLAPWETTELSTRNGRVLQVTATPARHGPVGIEPISGDVTGFVLASDDPARRAVYISGDTVWYEGVAEVARRFDVGIILLFLGAARLQERGPAPLTMTTADAIETARAFPDATLVPVHFDGWAHYSEGRKNIRAAFDAAGLAARLRLLESGQTVIIGP